MKKLVIAICAVFIVAIAILCVLFYLNNKKTEDKNSIEFSNTDPLNENYKGIGFEWDVYDTATLLTDEKWNTITKRADFFKPSQIRCMLNSERYFLGLNEQGQPVYDFDNLFMKNLYSILDYCEKNKIDVNIGLWGKPYSEKYKIKDETDDMYVRSAVDLIEYLVNEKKYTCIKTYINGNEPNYWRHYTDPYPIWKVSTEKISNSLKEKGLFTKVKIAGPDSTSIQDSAVWFEKSANDLKDAFGIYQMHGYLVDYLITKGKVTERLTDLKKILEKNDKDFKNKGLQLFESGLLDGVDEENNSNKRIRTYDYGLLMTDYTIQSLLAKLDGIIYWDFDDAMHLNSTGGYVSWGMFNSVEIGQEQALRPWYYTTSLLSRSFPKGSRILNTKFSNENIRAVAGLYDNNKKYSSVFVNQANEKYTYKIKLDQKIEFENLYVYIYNEKDVLVNGSGFAKANHTLSKVDMQKGFTLDLPSKSAVFVSSIEFK